MAQKDIDQGIQNELQALHLIHRFGWLRPQEIGRYIWPNSKHTEVYGVRLGIKLKKADFVIDRKLPRHCGTALVLSKKGAELLRNNGINASSGKDIGTTVNELWTPRKSWEHDLLANSLLILIREKFISKKYEITSEFEIRKQSNKISKIPDGIITIPNGISFWLEVENSKKSGQNMIHMMKSAINIEQYGETVLNRLCESVIFAYPAESEDNRKYKINHRLHIINSMKSQLLKNNSFTLTLFKVFQKSGAATSFEVEKYLVNSDEIERKAKNLYEIKEYRTENEKFYDVEIPYLIGIIKNHGEYYSWSVEHDESDQEPNEGMTKFMNGGICSTVLEGKMELVNLHFQYKEEKEANRYKN